jgi:hypothetical protein
MSDLIPLDPREKSLDTSTVSLVEHIRQSLAIHAELFDRILQNSVTPSTLLAELLEDVGNRYIDFSELVGRGSSTS